MGLFDRSFFDNETFPRIEWLDSELIDTTQVSVVGVGTTGEENVGAFTSDATLGVSSVGVDGSAAGATGIAITLVIALVGVDGSASGAFSSLNALDVNPTGVDGSTTGAFSGVEIIDVSPTGVDTSAAGAFAVAEPISVALVGIDSSAVGAFTANTVVGITVSPAGVDTSASGAVGTTIIPLPPPTPPAPTPGFIIIKPYGSELAGSGGGGSNFQYSTRHDRLNVDYALFAVGDARVLALADGLVEMIVDERSRTFVKLTADDGTQYIYAGIKVPTSKPRRVKKGELIGTARSGKAPVPLLQAAPTSQPPASLSQLLAASESAPAPSVFGVMPVVRQPAAPPPFIPRASLVWARAPATPPALVAPPPTLAALPELPLAPLTTGQKIILGVGVVAIVYALYKWIAAPPIAAPRRKKRRALMEAPPPPKKRKRKKQPQPTSRPPKRAAPKKRHTRRATDTSTTNFREARRLKAIKMIRRGVSIGEVAERLDVSHEAVRKWVAWRENGGVKALKAIERVGPKRKVSTAKLRAILSRYADLSLSQIAEVLYEKTGVRYSRTHISRLLDEL